MNDDRRIDAANAASPMPPPASGGRAFDLDVLSGAAEAKGRRLNILLLGDDRHAANVVRDHIDALQRHSRHRVFVLNPIHSRRARFIDFDDFDILIIHYSICVLFEYFLPPLIEAKVKAFKGLKVQIIQDEYRWIDRMAARISELGVSVLLSSLERKNLRRVYGYPELAGVTLYSTLPGYVPERLVGVRTPPIAERRIHVVYRGRRVPYWLGDFAQGKARIADQFATIAERHGLLVDLESSEDARIYGRTWIRFLTSGKATLATEGGATIFDFDGAVERQVSEYLGVHPDADFDTVAAAVLGPFEGNIVHKTITPRSFEAIALKTVLVMYPGRYRNVLEPWRHYIPIEPDGSNADEVATLLRDDVYLQQLADRAYVEIVERGRYAMKRYVRGIDGAIERGVREAAQRPGYRAVAAGRSLHARLRWRLAFHPSRAGKRWWNAFQLFLIRNRLRLSQLRVTVRERMSGFVANGRRLVRDFLSASG